MRFAALALLLLIPLARAAFPQERALLVERMKLVDFESGIPKNKAGDPYVSQYEGEKGKARVSLLPGGGVNKGTCAVFTVTEGSLYAQFNAHNADGSRGFAREYAADPKGWKFDTYNRLRFWVKNPPQGAPFDKGGNGSFQFGTYVKKVQGADTHSDEAGGGHWYHILNIPNTGTWTQVLINSHPHHFRGANGGFEEKNQPHPTGEPGYDYFDALTRFYLNETHVSANGRALEYAIDDFEFFREPYQENDEQVYSLAATYVPAAGRFMLSWSRDKDQNAVKHEVRWSDKNIHEIGWAKAKPVPGCKSAPAGWQGYNGMTCTTELKKAAGTVYFAIKPENSDLFSQIAVPTTIE
jgi:hypothetical protein